MSSTLPEIDLDPNDIVIGLDEVGRGCLAGAVVAAAVYFESPPSETFQDSKKLSPGRREKLSELLQKEALVAIGEASPQEIDKINILQASLLAMKRAYLSLVAKRKWDVSRVHLLIDGKFTIPDLKVKQTALIQGDSRIQEIAAASIVAKVYRDQQMTLLNEKFAHYGFAQHKGYPSPTHKLALKNFGVTEIHRKTFAGVRELIP